MQRLTTATLLLLTVAVATGMMFPAGAIANSSSSADQPTQTQDSSEQVSADVGQQLSTVVVATTEEVRTQADDAAFEQQLNQTNATERAEAVADRAAQLDQRASALRTEYESVTESYRNGEIDSSTYAQELAALSARASAIDSSVDRLEDRAAELSDAERRAVGVTDDDLQEISEQIDSISSPTASAILSQFTGESRGEIEFTVDGGIEIEVTNEDDEQSRQFERPRDGNGTLVLNQSEALTIATDALSEQEGEWILTGASTDDGAYEFEFDLHGTAAEGEAEVAVDGETGTIFEFEESVEFDDEDDDDDEREDDRLALRVTEGEPAPGETVTLAATQDGEPVENATVEVNEETVGQTDANGTLAVTLPDEEEAKIKATAGEAEGELEFEFEDREERELAATADITDGTVTVTVLLGDQPVDGANVTANEESVGTTAENGTVTFSLPDGDELEIEISYDDLEAELEYEFEEDEEEEEDEDDEDEEDNDEEGEEQELAITVTEGEPAPGETVTLAVTQNGDPVENATVAVNEETVGQTDANGTIAVTLPTEDADIDVTAGEAEGELEFELENEDEAEGDDEDGADDDSEEEGEDDGTDDDSEEEEDDDGTDDDDDGDEDDD